jgi:hypothetical protein
MRLAPIDNTAAVGALVLHHSLASNGHRRWRKALMPNGSNVGIRRDQGGAFFSDVPGISFEALRLPSILLALIAMNSRMARFWRDHARRS